MNIDKVYPIIGMSPGNSYFKDEEVRYLLSSVVSKYGHAAILVADVPAISTYVALGYPENRARHDKAIPKGNNLKNRTRRIAAELGYANQVRVIEWEEEIENNTDYQEIYARVLALYKTNPEFEKATDDTTKSVLAASGKADTNVEAATKIAVHYLLSEIAFLEYAPELLGAEKVAYVYHKNWPVYESYIAGKFDGIIKPNMDFILLENPYETYIPMWAGEEKDGDASALKGISNTHILRAAFSNYPPAFKYDKAINQFSGIFFEVITEIAKKNNWEIRWQEETGYGVIVEGLRSKRFDIFASTVWPTPERLKEADFSQPLFMSKVYVWAKEKTDLSSPALRVAIKEGDISHSIASADFPHARLVRVPQLASPDELLKFVAEDKADITFVEPYLAEQFNADSPIKLQRISEEPIREFGNTFMIRKDDSDFKELLNKEIQSLTSSGFVGELIQKYTGDPSTFAIISATTRPARRKAR